MDHDNTIKHYCGVEKANIDRLVKEKGVVASGIVANLKASGSPLTFDDDQNII